MTQGKCAPTGTHNPREQKNSFFSDVGARSRERTPARNFHETCLRMPARRQGTTACRPAKGAEGKGTKSRSTTPREGPCFGKAKHSESPRWPQTPQVPRGSPKDSPCPVLVGIDWNLSGKRGNGACTFRTAVRDRGCSSVGVEDNSRRVSEDTETGFTCFLGSSCAQV